SPGFAPELVDSVFDLAHLLIGNDEKIARATGRIKHADTRHAFAQVQQFAWIVTGVFEFATQVIEKQRIQHFQNIRHAGVVHTQFATLFVVGDRLNHGAKNIRVDLSPVEVADVQKV